MDPSMVEIPDSPDAIVVSNAFKSYGRGMKASHVLHNYRMTVKKGSIYALLGASGSGKTTILSCIVGISELDSGAVHIFGHPPRTPGLGVPGSRLGYMPQELSLNMEFSIDETIHFYGRVHRMTLDAIKCRLTFLTTFLQLPHRSRLIHTLSGGQQRRVSFALALLHGPELLVLDEPTVGVDPLLRQMVWSHLRQLTSKGNCTVLLTTHYIEEARHADMVGIMRNGSLLAQDMPSSIVSKHGSHNLEEVFLHLCLKEDQASANDLISPKIYVPAKNLALPNWQQISGSYYFDHILALVIKILVRQRRMWPLFASFFVIPPLIILIFCIVIGGDPMGLKMAVVNHEWPQDPVCQMHNDCQFLNFSCRFLQTLDHKMITLVPYDDETCASTAVMKGEAWGVITFPVTFSEAVGNRFINNIVGENDTMNNAVVRFKMDMSNQQIGYMVQRMVNIKFGEFIQQMLETCNINHYLSRPPIEFGDAVFGSDAPKFSEFMSPGILIHLSVGFSTVTAAVYTMLDRTTGISSRVEVSGISAWETLTASMLSMHTTLVLQVLAMMLTLYFYLNPPVLSTFPLVFLLVSLQGSMGLALGLLMSIFTPDMLALAALMLGTLFPVILTSGTLWPLEATPFRHMKWFCWLSPTMWATEATRSMMIRGWDITHWRVWLGFVTTIVWTVVIMLLIFIALRLTRRKLLI